MQNGSEGLLEVGAEVADEAAAFWGFFLGPLVVEGDEFFEELVVGEVMGEAVGVEDGGVEVGAELFEDGDEAAVVDLLVLGGEGGGGEGAGVDGAELLQDVVHVGEREVGIFLLLAFAVGVEFFGDLADTLLSFSGAGGEGECFEALGFYIDRIVASTQPTAGSDRPSHVGAAA